MTDDAPAAESPPFRVRDLRTLVESWQLAGVTHLPPLPPVSAPLVETPPPAAADVAPVSAAPPPAAAEPAAAPTPEPVSVAPVVEESSDSMPGRSKAQRLADLASQVAQCARCRELAETRTQTVFGVGNPNADILFVGEAPGADEDKQGEPFVGRAGQLLNKIIEACHLQREDIYICNILRCRPPGNRNPSREEAANCREYLDGQINVVKPKYIVCWGSVAAQNLLGVETPIGRMRGRFLEYAGAKVLCTYHPSYLLRNPSAKKDVWEDMKILFADMGVTL